MDDSAPQTISLPVYGEMLNCAIISRSCRLRGGNHVKLGNERDIPNLSGGSTKNTLKVPPPLKLQANGSLSLEGRAHKHFY
jgi:hypothetical protein